MATVSKTVTTTADGSGDATAYTDYTEGRLALIVYDGAHGAGTSLAISTETTGQNIWTEATATAKHVYPTVAMHDETGAVITQRDYPWVSGERVEIVVSGADAASVSTIRFVWAT